MEFSILDITYFPKESNKYLQNTMFLDFLGRFDTSKLLF